MKQKTGITTKKTAIIAMLVAFDVIFSRLLAVNVQTFKLGLGFAAIALCAMLYGPVWSALAAALSDLAGSLLFPTGAYFPGFTATAALVGLVYGLFLYKSRPNAKRCFLAALINGVAVTLLANTAMISFVFGAPFKQLLLTRLPEFAIMLAVQTLVLTALSSSDLLYGKIRQLREA